MQREGAATWQCCTEHTDEGHQINIYIDETKKYLLAFKITSRDVCATGICLKLNYFKIVGLHPTLLKNLICCVIE